MHIYIVITYIVVIGYFPTGFPHRYKSTEIHAFKTLSAARQFAAEDHVLYHTFPETHYEIIETVVK